MLREPARTQHSCEEAPGIIRLFRWFEFIGFVACVGPSCAGVDFSPEDIFPCLQELFFFSGDGVFFFLFVVAFEFGEFF